MAVAKKGGGIGEAGERAWEAEFAIGGCTAQVMQGQRPKGLGQHAHGQEEPARAGDSARLVGRNAATRSDAAQSADDGSCWQTWAVTKWDQ